MIVAIGGELFFLEEGLTFSDGDGVFFSAFDHGLQVLVILGCESLGGKDDLVFGIDQSLGVVALEHAVGGGHFHGLVINGIALDLFALAADLGFLVFDELVQTFDLKLEPFFPFLLMFEFQLRLLIRLNMFCQHPLEFLLQLITLVFEFIEGAAPLFGNVGG